MCAVQQSSVYLSILPQAERLHVRIAGDSHLPPLVLLHGAGADVTWRTWEPQLEAFAGVCRVYAPDWPGWGESGGVRQQGPERYDPRPMVELLTTLLAALHVEKAVFGGVSWGGLIALEWALEHPSRVERLLLVDAACRQEEIASGRYAAIDRPVWIAWADADPIVSIDRAFELDGSLPNSELVVFPGTTHWPHHMHAAEFNRRALSFLGGGQNAHRQVEGLT